MRDGESCFASWFKLHPTNRGVALFEDAVYLATVDAYVVALDAATGEVRWEREVEDYLSGYYMTMAPLIAKVSPNHSSLTSTMV